MSAEKVAQNIEGVVLDEDMSVGNDKFFRVAKTPQNVHRIEIGEHVLLVSEQGQGNNTWIRWALLENAGGDNAGAFYSCAMSGEGPAGSLREPRHTWFGEGNGYIFYVHARLIAETFRRLEYWFDYPPVESIA